VSDLEGYGGQFTLGISPDPFKFRAKYSCLHVVRLHDPETRRQYRGFDGAAVR
jgi:hypothetical protein